MSLERRDTNALQNRSGNIPEHKHGKPGNEWGRFPEWSSSWSRHLPQPDCTKIWPRNWPRHGDKVSERAMTANNFSWVGIDWKIMRQTAQTIKWPSGTMFAVFYQKSSPRGINQFNSMGFSFSWFGQWCAELVLASKIICVLDNLYVDWHHK